MKRLSLLGFVGLLSSVLAGCPIFADGNEDDSSSTTDIPPSTSTSTCSATSDCGNNETCGKDNRCHTGDCSFSGCSDGFTCVVDKAAQTAACKPSSQVGDSKVVYCGNPKDCIGDSLNCASDGQCHTGNCTVTGCIYGYTCGASGTCTRTNPAGCAVDTDCAGAGAGFTCVSGLCTQPSELCFDQTQCAAGDSCVTGKCTPACPTSASACSADSGYACDANLVCQKPIKGCKITNDCGGPNAVCVAGACVPRSAGAKCATPGTVWVDNGCIPDQKASFTCDKDGKQDGKQDVCLAGSLCLHHSCYISCETDATVCTTQPALNQCKAVTTTSGDHKVCGSKENLGNECDPTAAKACSVGNICIDGFCK